jgi:hypothetical protein
VYTLMSITFIWDKPLLLEQIISLKEINYVLLSVKVETNACKVNVATVCTLSIKVRYNMKM